MKIKMMSDIHLEFCSLEVKEDDADVVVLAGDIFTPWRKPERAVDFFESIRRFKDVIYIMGNHEHYHGRFKQTYDEINEFLQTGCYNNVHFLENDFVEIDGYRFIGCTLWTDMNSYDPSTVLHCEDVMNDYRIVHTTTRRLRAEDTVSEHFKSRDFIENSVKESMLPCIVVTHHGPTYKSIHPRYHADHLGNGAYASNLSEIMLNNDDKIKMWIHGHTHKSHDYMCGNTRVVCNPRGYQTTPLASPENEEFCSEIILEV